MHPARLTVQTAVDFEHRDWKALTGSPVASRIRGIRGYPGTFVMERAVRTLAKRRETVALGVAGHQKEMIAGQIGSLATR